MFQFAGFVSRILGSAREEQFKNYNLNSSRIANCTNSGRGRDYMLDMDSDSVANNESDEDFVPVNLKLVISISGKRKSGKDHISTLITNYVGHQRMHYLAILRIAAPIKERFSIDHKLDMSRLLDSSEYKEEFRQAMVDWSEKYREEEGWNCFLKQAIKEQRAKYKPIWILNDARRPCDIEYFESDPTFANTKIIKLRIEASDVARMSRGWQFQKNIDDKPTECGLDEYEDWTHVITNNSNDNKDAINRALRPIYQEIDKVLSELEEEEKAISQLETNREV